MRKIWILWTRQACGGAGTAGATRVEVCPSARWAMLGAPHHGFKQACYSYDVDDAGNLTSECHEWDTDDAGWPPDPGSWALKLGPFQVAMLKGCLEAGGWYRHCGWGLYRNVSKTVTVARRLTERGFLKAEERVVKGQRVTVYTVVNPDLCQIIIENNGVVPREALGEVTR